MEYLRRSTGYALQTTSKILKMSGADPLSRGPRPIFTFNSKEDINGFATGSDLDIGGRSTVHLDLHETPNEKPTGRFWGDMQLGLRAGADPNIRGGYAGFRNKRRPTLFGEITEDLSLHSHLKMRLRMAGSPRLHNSFFVNIQTDGPISTDLWQHRLYMNKLDNTWEDVFIPLSSFILTNSGEISGEQIIMYSERVRSIGISVLGGNSGVEGPYELGIDSVWAVNAPDVSKTSACISMFAHEKKLKEILE